MAQYGVDMPFDFDRVMAQKVITRQAIAHRVDLFPAERQIRHVLVGGVAILLDDFIDVRRVIEAASNHHAGGTVELLEQRVFPVIPQFRIGATDIGDG